MKLIDLHKKWMETGTMGKVDYCGGGLCNLLPSEYNRTLKEIFKIDGEMESTFWASGYTQISQNKNFTKAAYDYTPLRQTIVLFICAMHNEL